MNSNKNIFRVKADELKKELKHTKVTPVRYVKFCEDVDSYQGLCVKDCGKASCPIELKLDEPVILDFGRHCVGYLKYKLSGGQPIVDSPVELSFAFGEFPLEIEKDASEYKGMLGKGWIQRENKSSVFLPTEVSLERRYSFRYVKITRTANTKSQIFLSEIFADCVSAVALDDAEKIEISDPVLRKIYDMSMVTLKECEQDVFEDGPKRDRRLWIGDLRLQALSDYVSFRNIDLIKRCIYLFAAHRVSDRVVAPCVFPDSPPFMDSWYFVDYSLYFVSCLYDYTKTTKDLKLAEELYDVAKEQIHFVKSLYEEQAQNVPSQTFVDWCPGLDNTVSSMGIYLYVLNQFKELSEILGKDNSEAICEYERVSKLFGKFYSKERGLFVAESGQISWHSQIWAVLSGTLSDEQGRKLLERIRDTETDYTMRTPYMIHYYIEALYKVGEKNYAMNYIKTYWSQILDSGYDCCPEIFNPDNPLESPYEAPEINSACHAWSCTPVYWIHKYCNEGAL